MTFPMKYRLPFIFALVALLGCGASHHEQETTAGHGSEDASPPSSIAGEAIFSNYCASCHGADGTAGIAGAANLRLLATDSILIRKTVLNGKGLMPPFRHKLSAQEITRLINHLKRLRN